MDDIKAKLIDNYNTLLANEEEREIKALELGYITNDCFIIVFPILIHCIENINIFSDEQCNNINHFINTIRNG